uniref:interleukin-12 receptor subunit beta-1 n=1 Tax=Jaculus jaculus TaxID=51337 RepID=UPI001E1B2C8F|nr:interleukin-12 receptor subunit beta-1 [Jaculus jaculus]
MELQGTSLSLLILLQCALGGAVSGPRDLRCYRVESKGHYQCSWEYEGTLAGVSHFLRGCVSSRSCCHFAAGSATLVQFTDQDINVLSNVTLWVESRLENRTEKSPEITLNLYNWVLFDPPPRKIDVIGSAGQLHVAWQTPQIGAEVQFRRRTPSSAWKWGDCGPQRDGPSESCLCPWEKDVAQEIQFRRRRLESGAPGGPWSSWSDPACFPPETVPLPEVQFLEKPLGSNGKRQVTIHGQLPQMEHPEGCAEATLVNYTVHVHMVSCCCEASISRRVRRATLELSGAAYRLRVLSHSRFGSGPNQTWHIPARDLPGLGTLNISVEGNTTSLHWATHALHASYCIEWQLQSQQSHANCTFVVPHDGDPVRTATHSWSWASGALGREECYRMAVFAALRPKKLMSWSTVLTAYYFGGNASESGIPHHVSVKNHSKDSVSVEWSPSMLGTCPGVLRQYVLRCRDEDSKQVTERLLPPTQTRVTLRHLRGGTLYSVQVRADAAWRPGAWSSPQRFRLEVQISHWSVLFTCLGSFVSVLLLGSLGYLGLNRAVWHLCPPLPTPCGSSAVEFPRSQCKQTWQWTRPGDFPEVLSQQETFVVEMTLDKELPQDTPEPALNTEPFLDDQRQDQGQMDSSPTAAFMQGWRPWDLAS